jgi:hypothetical protein
MFSNPESPLCWRVPCALACALFVLTACAWQSADTGSAASRQAAIVAAEEAARQAAAAAAVASARAAAGEAVAGMLAYAERVRMMQPPELAQEVARLGDTPTPTAQMQLAVALSQLRQLPELVRAQEMLARVLGNPEAEALHPLARLLAARFTEQRRVEEQVDKQNQQAKDLQRRLDQTNERLEALKAIERSLTTRPPAAAVVPAPAGAASRPRPAASP